MTKSRVFVWGLLVFIGGIGLRSFVILPLFVVLIVGLFAVTAITIGLLRRSARTILYGSLLILFLFGVLRFELAASLRPDLTLWYGKQFVMQGVVAAEPEFTEKAQRFKFHTESVYGKVLGAPFFILVTARKYPAYRIGDELEIKATLKQPENYSDFNYVSYLARDDIFAVISFPGIEKTGEGKGNRLILALSHIKHAFENNIDAALPEPHAAFLKGLLLGERAALPSELIEQFKVTGTTHIIALSGYNITIIGRALSMLLLMLGVSFFVSFWIAVGSIILFVLMVGASASITRAAIMGILVLVAQREGRAYRIANALVFAGAAMVAHNPYILRFDAAFQLSFLATVGLVFLSSPMSQWLDRLRMRAVSFLTGKTDTQGLRKERKSGYNSFHRFILAVQYTLAETLCAQLMVLPLLIWLFGKVSLVSPITNILVLLAVPYAMASGFFAGLLGFIWYPLGSIAGFVAWFLLGYIIYMIELFARLPGAAINIGAWILAPLLFAYGVVGVMWMRRQNQTVIQ